MTINVRHEKGRGQERLSVMPGMRVKPYRDVTTGALFWRRLTLIQWSPF